VAEEGWWHQRARALSDEGDDPELTDRVGPPVSEREATAESDKRSRRRPKRTSGRIGQAEQATGRLGWTGREEVGRSWAEKKIREEAEPKIRKKEFLN
jgi:hypothetical protein